MHQSGLRGHLILGGLRIFSGMENERAGFREMVKKTSAVVLGALIFLLAGAGWAQQKPEEVPDAPSASRPGCWAREFWRGRITPAAQSGTNALQRASP